jgi:predicted enzyme related to lactoylglutathione lyase
MVLTMARVTGIGGVFFKSNSNHKQLAAWYARHLGLRLEDWGGAILRWPEDDRADGGATVWHAAAKSTEWFSPSDSSFMINYRVDDLDELLAQLRRDGVPIVSGPETHDNGRFAWLLDPDGNKIELWQPLPAGDKNEQR